MKIKQIKWTFLLPVFTLALSLVAAVATPDSAAALTQAEKKECYEQWAGGYVGSAGNGTKLTSAQFTNFENRSKCNDEKGGSCKIVRYSDGAVIQCQRKDGKYDSGGGWNKTTGGGSGETGDDGTDTPAGCTGECSANDPNAGDDCGGVKTALIKCDAENSGDITDNGIWALLLMGLNILTAGVGIFAVAGIVYGAVLYTTAEDKADQVKQAVDIIRNVVIGIILFALMWSGLNFIVPGGIFQ